MGAIEAAFEAAAPGIRIENEVRIAHAKFRNSGGTKAQLLALVEDAYRMPDQGHASVASNGLISDANIRHPQGDGAGHSVCAGNGPLSSARPSPTQRDDGGRHGSADKARRHMPPSSLLYRSGAGQSGSASGGRTSIARPAAVPQREPSKSQIASMVAVRKDVTVTIMDTLKIDGKAIGDWTVGDALSAGRDKICNGHILVSVSQYVVRHYANADSKSRVRDWIKVAELQRIIQRAAEVVDAA